MPALRLPALLLPALLIVLFIQAMLLPVSLSAQQGAGDTLDKLTARAQEAITRNAYESAVQILTEAKTRYPTSPRASLALGDLYYDKELYTLALAEYREAEKKGATDFATLTQISRSFAKLNQEKSSIEYLTRILQQYPDSTDTMDDLGWMYFKTHQLDKGEKVLLRGITKAGPQRGLTMTLGTVYSGMNRYDKSREYYLKAVDDAQRVGDRNFASIAYYNLSLLEHSFFHYNSALRYTDESIAMEDRPSGHLARGELFQSRMDFGSAQQEYQAAYAKDTTPLSKVNLAILFQKFGRLDLSRRYAEEVLGSKDYAWLVYYGTDLTRHLKELHELLGIVYRGLAVREASRPTTGLFDRVSALVSSVRNRILSWYHEQRFRAFSLRVGTQYLDQGSYEDAWWEYYKGNESYAEVALKYLGMTRALETGRSPHAVTFYVLEEGKVRRSPALLEQSVAGFDPFWEKEPAADALASLIPLLDSRSERARRRDAIVRLYAINPGALPQAGIGLPLAVTFEGAGWRDREKALVLRFLRRSGSECVEGPREGFDETLRLLATGGANPNATGYGGRPNAAEYGGRGVNREIRWTVRDSSGNVAREGRAAPAGNLRQRSAALVREILEELYSVH